MGDIKTIKVCSYHKGKEVTPLIWTFAFNGAEYWCPYCGFTGGIFGSGIDVKWTEELQELHDYYKKKSKLFLNAKSTIISHSITVNGKERTYASLPPQTREYYERRANSWKYKNNE